MLGLAVLQFLSWLASSTVERVKQWGWRKRVFWVALLFACLSIYWSHIFSPAALDGDQYANGEAEQVPSSAYELSEYLASEVAGQPHVMKVLPAKLLRPPPPAMPACLFFFIGPTGMLYFRTRKCLLRKAY